MNTNHFQPKIIVFITLVLSILLTACGVLPGLGVGQPDTIPTPLNPVPGLASVDSIQIQIVESIPVQVEVIARGTFPDGCTTIGQTLTKLEGSTFTITLITDRDPDVACTQAISSFDATVPLDVAGLKAGVYIVYVNGIGSSFELSVDNVSQPAPTSTPTLPPTQAPPTPAPTLPPSPVPPTPTSTPVPIPCDRAQFVKDVTVPDNTSFPPGASFTKTWRLKNVGSCTWTTDYDLVFASGNPMTDKLALALPHAVKPGETVDLSVNLIAPDTDGTYKGQWMLQNAANKLFGLGVNADKTFWVQIKVIAGGPGIGANTYSNAELAYQILYPTDWIIDVNGLAQASKEVMINPPQAEPFITYVSISVDPRSLEVIREAYASQHPGAIATDIVFAGVPALQFTYGDARIEIYMEKYGRTYRLASDRWNLTAVQDVFSTFEFINH